MLMSDNLACDGGNKEVEREVILEASASLHEVQFDSSSAVSTYM